MPKFFITTLGCKVNQSESEAIAEALKASGWTCRAQKQDADLYIVNTCAVTRKAAMQSRQAVRQAIKAHPKARILVTGCYAQTEPQALEKIEGIDRIVGHTAKHEIPQMIHPAPGRVEIDAAPCGPGLNDALAFEQAPVMAGGSRTRPFLKIQDGCDACCSYCIVPLARGRSRSMPFGNVIESITRLARAGYREAVLCGIHIGCYGLDLSPPTGLLELLQHIDSKTRIDRVRLSSIEPAELTDGIIQLAARSERICPHFHIPLQSGDDSILKRMRRPYTRSFFRDLVLKIHAAVPDAAIGVDILVGFPGETEAAFENTVALIEELPVTYLHVFPFSARPGTPAARFSQPVSDSVVKSRCRRMRRIGIAKKSAFYSQYTGRTVFLLIENKREATGMLKGITPNYIPVVLNGPDSLKNTIVRARIDSVENQIVYGTVIA